MQKNDIFVLKDGVYFRKGDGLWQRKDLKQSKRKAN